MKTRIVYFLSGAGTLGALVLLALVVRGGGVEPTASAAARGGTAAGDVAPDPTVASQGPSYSTVDGCASSTGPVASRGALGALELLAGDASGQAVAVATGYPHEAVRLAAANVVEPAVALARRMVTDDTLAHLASAPVVAFVRGEGSEQLALFVGVERTALQLPASADVLWLAPDAVAFASSPRTTLCHRDGPSARERLHTLDQTLTRTATMAGYWNGELDGLPSGCRSVIGAIHLGTNRQATGHGYVFCGGATEARVAAPLLAAWRPVTRSITIPGSVIQGFQPEGVVPRDAYAEANRVRVEFGGRIDTSPPRLVTDEELRYYRRGEAEPPWERLDPYGVPEMDGPPPGYENIDGFAPEDPRRPGGPIRRDGPPPAPPNEGLH